MVQHVCVLGLDALSFSITTLDHGTTTEISHCFELFWVKHLTKVTKVTREVSTSFNHIQPDLSHDLWHIKPSQRGTNSAASRLCGVEFGPTCLEWNPHVTIKPTIQHLPPSSNNEDARGCERKLAGSFIHICIYQYIISISLVYHQYIYIHMCVYIYIDKQLQHATTKSREFIKSREM